MCLGVPARIIEVKSPYLGRADVAGVTRDVGLQLIENPAVGDWVLIHAGYAINRMDEDQARETIGLLEELREKL
jgi:hydrogenase expression/formation protein HypC